MNHLGDLTSAAFSRAARVSTARVGVVFIVVFFGADGTLLVQGVYIIRGTRTRRRPMVVRSSSATRLDGTPTVPPMRGVVMRDALISLAPSTTRKPNGGDRSHQAPI